ncbi:MAG: SWF/SNF helicase family protein, partial [Planctomycetaceae bacterium]|nr:SWF/SNF helicase family protein [Planctomycetaceae bacterium]
FEQHAESNPQAKQASDDTRMHLRREVDALLTDRWYLEQFDAALERQSAAVHPKLAATVHRAADLWEQGEKIVVFAFYRETCRALRSHISNEIERRLLAKARFRLGLPDGPQVRRQVEWRLQQIQDRYFDKPKAPGKRAMDAALDALVQLHAKGIDALDQPAELRAGLISVMRRFLRVQTTLVRCYPFEIERELQHAEIASRLLDHADASGMTWRQKFDEFIGFLLGRCSRDDRAEYLAALGRISTGAQRVGEDGDAEDDGDIEGDGNLGIAGRDPRTPSKTALANIALCIGATKLESRLRRMRGFNTPFFPDILVCSEVMSEGVDLQRFCRHVIHHDLAWNPSTIEQRTGRVDRIGCKAMNRHPIQTYLPYIGGGADERQFRVMRDRERWFQVVMGQDAVANLINAETVDRFFPLPASLVDSLAFDLGIRAR